MTKARFSQIGSVILILVLLIGLYFIIKTITGWSWYAVWLIAINLVTFFVYGLDKGMAKTSIPVRVPEILLHLLALMGGFIGGWAGMFVFHHKTNWKAHPLFPIILALSTVIHVILIIILLTG